MLFVSFSASVFSLTLSLCNIISTQLNGNESNGGFSLKGRACVNGSHRGGDVVTKGQSNKILVYAGSVKGHLRHGGDVTGENLNGDEDGHE